MKKIIIILLIFIMLIPQDVIAEESFNINDWSFIMLTHGSDQDENVIVSKFYNVKDRSKYSFCIEPTQDFRPNGNEYIKRKYENENIYKIVKAYDEIGNNDNDYYIAAQLLIWKEIDGIDYTFDGNDYQEYKQELLTKINKNRPLFKSISNNSIEEAYFGQEYTIDNDYSEYNAESDDLTILSNDANGLKYIIENKEPIVKTINFTPKEKDEDHSFVFESEDSQDLYHYDGDYSNLEPFSLNIRTLFLPSSMTINFSKKDEEDNNINGAEFTLYQIDEDNGEDELIFFQTNIDINIYEALLDNYLSYSDLNIVLSERYLPYLNGNIFNTNEIGYFPYEIYNDNEKIKEGIVYVTNDTNQSNGLYNKISINKINTVYSNNVDINSINNVPLNSKYYLCESEPKKGYTYKTNACSLIDSNTYSGETINYVNSERTYKLKLVKESPQEIPLNGAKFKITYNDNGIEKDITFVTGTLQIEREENKTYLIYKYENSLTASVVEFNDDVYILNNVNPGSYYYYESNSNIIDYNLLNDNYIDVVDGGYSINNLPYNSSLRIEELIAPAGYIITDPVYYVTPDIKYSEITFKNYRVNYLDIIPAKIFKIPKTCVER